MYEKLLGENWSWTLLGLTGLRQSAPLRNEVTDWWHKQILNEYEEEGFQLGKTY